MGERNNPPGAMGGEGKLLTKREKETSSSSLVREPLTASNMEENKKRTVQRESMLSGRHKLEEEARNEDFVPSDREE